MSPSELWTGAAHLRLGELVRRSVDLILTHPPTYGQTATYGPEVVWPTDDWTGRLGQEPTVRRYVQHLGYTLDAAWRAMTLTGQLWVATEDNRRRFIAPGVLSSHPGGELNAIPELLVMEMEKRSWTYLEHLIWYEDDPLHFHHLLGFGRSDGWRPGLEAGVYNFARALPQPGDKFYRLPEGLIESVIEMTSPPGGLVVDPFAGTGTVLTVAERLGRRAIGIEVDPEQVAVYEAAHA